MGAGLKSPTVDVAAVVDEFLGGGEVVLRGFQRVRLGAEDEAGAMEVDVG
jgi:hypothetical protein